MPQGEAPVLGVCRTNDPLQELPRVTSWQEAGGAYITLPLIYTESLMKPQKHSLGMHRLRFIDHSTAEIDWQRNQGAGLFQQEAAAAGEALPVSVFIGGPPALMAAAGASHSVRLPALVLASLILGSRLPMVRTRWAALHSCGSGVCNPRPGYAAICSAAGPGHACTADLASQGCNLSGFHCCYSARG